MEKFVNDKKRWAYTFHNIAFLTRMKLILEALTTTKKKFIILDRSLMSDVKTFAPVLYDDGYLDKFELNTYLMWNQFFSKYFSDYSNGYSIIYLRTDPKVAFERMAKRARPEEKPLDLSYFEKLHGKHDEWLLDECQDEGHVLVLDGNTDFQNNEDDYKKMLKQILRQLI